jgi:hypothetical protein
MGTFDNWNALAPCVEDFYCFGIHGSRYPQGESGWKKEVDRHFSLEVPLTVDKCSVPMVGHSFVTKKLWGKILESLSY